MKPDKMRNLAIECGARIKTESWFCGSPIEVTYFNLSDVELAAYTAAVEAPLQARISQLEDQKQRAAILLAQYVNSTADEYATWLSEHDKEVEARERERCRLIASEHPHHYGNAISLMIGELK